MPRDLRVRDLILGTMKSAKSAQLIMKGHLLDLQGKKVLTFAPEMNTRDGAFITSRALPHLKRPAIVVPEENNGGMISTRIWIDKPDVVLIDELQFFTVEQVERIAEISLTYDVDIYTYGLMMSYNGKMFDSIKRAIECGFRITTLDMSCDECNNDATHHLLYVNGSLQLDDGDGIAVEDTEDVEQEYKSVCYSCYTRALDLHEMEQAEKYNKALEDAKREIKAFFGEINYDAPF